MNTSNHFYLQAKIGSDTHHKLQKISLPIWCLHQLGALVRCLEWEIVFSILQNLLFRTNYFLFRTNFIESAFLERCFIARLHCFCLGNHNRIHTEKQYVCL